MTRDTRAKEKFVLSQYERHSTSVFRRCLKMGGGNVHWAEDVTQDVFIRLLEAGEELHAQDDLGGWLSRVATNCCIDKLRRERSIWSRVANALTATRDLRRESGIDARADAKQELKRVGEAMDTLDPNERAVFSLVHLEGMSQKEVVDHLGITKGYVSKLFKRATEKVAKRSGAADD